MSKRKPKTMGAEWLFHSMSAFNGSGYADKSSTKAYLESYIFYKAWRKEPEALQLAKLYGVEALCFAERLVGAREAGTTPSDKNLDAFNAFKARAGLLL